MTTDGFRVTRVAPDRQEPSASQILDSDVTRAVMKADNVERSEVEGASQDVLMILIASGQLRPDRRLRDGRPKYIGCDVRGMWAVVADAKSCMACRQSKQQRNHSRR